MRDLSKRGTLKCGVPGSCVLLCDAETGDVHSNRNYGRKWRMQLFPVCFAGCGLVRDLIGTGQKAGAGPHWVWYGLVWVMGVIKAIAGGVLPTLWHRHLTWSCCRASPGNAVWGRAQLAPWRNGCPQTSNGPPFARPSSNSPSWYWTSVDAWTPCSE